MKNILLLNLIVALFGIVFLSWTGDRETAANLGLFLFSLFPLLGFLLAANLLLLFISLCIKSQRKKVSAYLLAVLIIVIAGVLTFAVGLVTMGKIGG